MAAKLISGPQFDYQFEAVVTAGVAIQEGDILDKSGNVLQRATSSSTIHTIFGVAGESISAAATLIKVIPILNGPQQIWELSTTNNEATTMRYETNVLTDHATLNNTDSDVTGPTGVFTQTGFSGLTTDKKAIGFFNRLGATST